MTTGTTFTNDIPAAKALQTYRWAKAWTQSAAIMGVRTRTAMMTSSAPLDSRTTRQSHLIRNFAFSSHGSRPWNGEKRRHVCEMRRLPGSSMRRIDPGQTHRGTENVLSYYALPLHRRLGDEI